MAFRVAICFGNLLSLEKGMVWRPADYPAQEVEKRVGPSWRIWTATAFHRCRSSGKERCRRACESKCRGIIFVVWCRSTSQPYCYSAGDLEWDRRVSRQETS